MISRRKSREFLLQSLYARVNLGSGFRRDIFLSGFFPEEQPGLLDIQYLDTMESHIATHEPHLLGLIEKLAPKFELPTLPTLHLLIMMIALSEMIYLADDTIPQSVSMNEAIELAKTFSDDQGRLFINGALSTFLKDRETLLSSSLQSSYSLFSI